MSTKPNTNDDLRLLELLERWQSGDFSRADEREMRALAGTDDFRREAVEGFLSLPEADHAARLAALRARLRPGARRMALPRWMAAAAALALLVAAVWFFQNPKPNDADTLAQTEAIERTAPPPPPDSNTSATITDAEQTIDNQSFKTPAKSKTGARPADDLPVGDVAVAEPSRDEAAGYSAPGVVAERSTNIATQQEEAAELAKAAEQKDLSTVPATKPGAPAPEAKTDAARAKKTVPQGAVPVGGWDEFRRYLRRNARLPEAARQNNVSGSVRVQFRLDENSQPVDFQILRSLGYGCDEEAIRLLQAQAWQRGSDQAVSVDVPFVR
jgi:outer membrane biosynthesis protein TonB